MERYERAAHRRLAQKVNAACGWKGKQAMNHEGDFTKSVEEATATMKKLGGGKVAQLEREIDATREHLSEATSELRRRGAELLPAVAIGAAALAVAGVAFAMWRRHEDRGVPARWLSSLSAQVPASLESGKKSVRALRKRAARALDPQPPARPVRSALMRIGTAALSAAVVALAKHFAVRLIKEASARSPAPSPSVET